MDKMKYMALLEFFDIPEEKAIEMMGYKNKASFQGTKKVYRQRAISRFVQIIEIPLNEEQKKEIYKI